MKRWKELLCFGGAGLCAVLAVVFKFLFVGTGFLALVCLCLGALLPVLWTLGYLARRKPRPWRVLRRVFLVLLALGISVAAVTEAVIVYFSLGSPQQDCEYVVILGCMVRPDGPSVTLQNRIDAAADYMEAHPDAVAIASGGQGPDEPMTEARCIYEGLVARGIDPERIWLEERSTSTWENLQFSLDLIQDRTGVRPKQVGVVSSEFHLCRASLHAGGQGLQVVGIPAKTTIPVQALNHFLREIAGVWHYILLGGSYE